MEESCGIYKIGTTETLQLALLNAMGREGKELALFIQGYSKAHHMFICETITISKEETERLIKVLKELKD